MIDFIGDIHGHTDKLKSLLQKLGYECRNGTYSHTERKVLFVGDYIDRGPKILETLYLVRRMVDDGNAIALMGNHEYNAICFHFEEREGGHLRKHEIKNIIQHYETLNQFQNKQKEYEEYIDWFKTLPLFYETDNFRAIHACWDNKNLEFLKTQLKKDRLTENLIYQSVIKDSALNNAINQSLKGKEIKMPAGLFFTDKDRTKRSEIRIKWWEDPSVTNYKKISVESIDNLPESNVDLSLLSNSDYYIEKDKPVFFGHYWLNGKPMLYRDNICCLDYSIANQGKLVAYRFDGEQILSNKKIIYV